LTTGTATPITLGLRRFWRIPVAAFLGALLGFAGSFIFGVAYEAKTRVLLHPNNLTVLQANGSTIVNQGSQIDQATIGRAMAETQTALLDNRVIATKIVEKLHLDKKVDNGGFVNAVKGVFVTPLKYVSSYLLHGTYKNLPRHEQAVRDTQKNISANEVGFSWELAVTGRWKTPEQATAIANLAADYLVKAGEQRFQDDVNANTKNLAEQVKLAADTQQKAAQDLATWATSNAINPTTLGVGLTPELAAKLTPELQTQYQGLQTSYNTSSAALAQLQVQYQQAQVYAGVKPVELTRVDTAVPSVYPVKPKRWLYMAIGIVLGSLIGLGLTARWFWRRGETMFPRDDDYPPRDDSGARSSRPAESVSSGPAPEAVHEVVAPSPVPSAPEMLSSSLDEPVGVASSDEAAPQVQETHPEQFGTVHPSNA